MFTPTNVVVVISVGMRSSQISLGNHQQRPNLLTDDEIRLGQIMQVLEDLSLKRVQVIFPGDEASLLL
ncbi:hypothetical protein Cni_G03933 [Canna indica]|uniref:Uncharacterized protein n=1 Tax=Canna indica TaxID=4628 RepID=A0AAQ3JSI9_9LILI|nr:hypothetical protein Cni_G03933 [Canna indica]